MNLLYVVKRPLVGRDFDRYGIGFMLDRGHHVSLLDVSQPCHPELDNRQTGVVRDPRLDVRVVRDWAEFRREKNLLKSADLIFFLIQSYGHSRMTLPALRLIGTLDRPFLIMAPTMYAGGAPRIEELPMSRALTEALKRLRFADPINSLIARVPKDWLGVPSAAAAIYSSTSSVRPNSLVGPGTRPIYTHSPDFDIYRSIRDMELPRLDQAVFIDQWLPHHPDMKAMARGVVIDAGTYYGQLRLLFDRIERELGLEVVIAPHPRAQYGLGEVFGGRRLLGGQTARLIAQSRLAIGHYSTAIGLAAAFRTPVMLLAERNLYDAAPFTRHTFTSFAKELGLTLSFLDEHARIDLTGALALDEAKWQRYVDTYMRHPNAPDLPMWETIAQGIATL